MSEHIAGTEKTRATLLMRGAIWIAIGSLIAAAFVCVFWVLIDNQSGLIPRAFLTILLLAGFAGMAIVEASLAPHREEWFTLASMASWVVVLLVGAAKIWMPPEEGYGDWESLRFWFFLLAIGVLQLALVHVRLYVKAWMRHQTTFTTIIFWATVSFLVALVVMLVLYLTFPRSFTYEDMYWRVVVALVILAAVGTMLIPLLNVLFAPKPATRVAVGASVPTAREPLAQAWPTYVDGRTPLPMLADGTPDWRAYYEGPSAERSNGVQAPGGVTQASGVQPVPAAHTLAPSADTLSAVPDVEAPPSLDDTRPAAPQVAVPAAPDNNAGESEPVVEGPATPPSPPSAFPPPPPVVR